MSPDMTEALLLRILACVWGHLSRFGKIQSSKVKKLIFCNFSFELSYSSGFYSHMLRMRDLKRHRFRIAWGAFSTSPAPVSCPKPRVSYVQNHGNQVADVTWESSLQIMLYV